MNSIDSRKYVGIRFGLSISASPDAMYARRNMDDVVNQFLFQEANTYLFEGGRLVLGHRWKRGGVMEHLAAKARDFRSYRPVAIDPVTEKRPPAILNLLAWPDEPPERIDSMLQCLLDDGTLEIRTIEPEGIDLHDLPNDSSLYQFARMRALTAMRREMVDQTDIRICVGGAGGKPQRRIAGVIEEALLTYAAGKPLYIAGALGGAARAMADAILQRTMTTEAIAYFYTPADNVAIFREHAALYSYPEPEGPSVEGEWNAFQAFSNMSLNKLALQAGLTEDEYIRLLTTPDLNRAMTCVTAGVSTWVANNSSPN